MNFGQSFEMALKAIASNKMRSFLTMLGIIIGVSAVVIMVSLVQGLNNQTLKEMESYGTNKIDISAYNASNDPQLFEDLYEYCKKNPQYFAGVTPSASSNASLAYKKTTLRDQQVYYGNDQYHVVNNWTLVKGRNLTITDVDNKNRVCVLGATTNKQLFNFETAVGKTIRVNGEELLVVGVFDYKVDPNSEMAQWNQLDQFVLVPYTLQRTLAKNTVISQYSVKAVSSEAAVTGTAMIRTFLTPYFRNEDSFYVGSTEEWKGDYQQSAFMMSLVVGAIAGISLLVGGIGIMNIMLVSVSERTREIGIRKAIGANRSSIVVQFLIEAATVSASGGVIGMLLGTLGTVVAGKLALKSFLLPGLGIMLFSFFFSVALGMVFGVYPANKASKMNPIDALRNE